jgi:putative transposase
MMLKDEKEMGRRSIRLKEYDYAQHGAYFVTICTENRECLFGNIIDGKMRLNEAGNIAETCWKKIPLHYPSVMLDEYIVMPNHIHGILSINNPSESTQNTNKFQKIISGSIGAIVRGYKTGVTKWFRANTNIFMVWQRNYYEQVIRDEADLNHIREYIIYNPTNWKDDELFL